MASKVTIANLALLQLGEEPIVSFDDGSDSANRVSVLYDEAVLSVLSKGAWSFATFRAELAALTTTPEWEFSYAFQLPTNPKLLKLLKINGNEMQDVYHKVEQDHLLINTSAVKIKYLGSVTDSGSFNEFFKDTLVEYLKYQLAYAITSTAPLAEKIYAVFQDTLSTSLMLDGQQGHGDRIITPDLIEVRGDSPILPE